MIGWGLGVMTLHSLSVGFELNSSHFVKNLKFTHMPLSFFTLTMHAIDVINYL